jgi:hypothetical protein
MPFNVGSTYPLQVLITANGAGVPGQTPTVVLQRQSDLNYWNGATSFTPVYTQLVMPPVDAINQPGLYSIPFNQSIDNTPQTYVAYYQNTTVPYNGVAVEEIVFEDSVASVNLTAIAAAVAAKLLVNPSIKIDSSDIASQNTLLSVLSEVEEIEDNMALESTLLSGIATIENDLNEIISIIQPISGSNQITFIFKDQNNLPIPGVKVTIKNTTNQITLAVGIADTNGQLVLGLPNGSFNVLFFKSFIQFPTQPYSLVVNGNATVTINCVTFQPTAPAPNLCACFCYLTDASGNPVTGILIRAKLIDNFPFSPGSAMLATKDYVECLSDATGFVNLNLIQGGYYEISAPSLFFTLTDWQVPVQASLDLSTVLGMTS